MEERRAWSSLCAFLGVARRPAIRRALTWLPTKMVVATSWGIGGNEVSWVREGPRRRLRKGLSGERNGRSGPRQREASFRRME